MKSVRLDQETEHQLEAASKARGITESEFIREAIRNEAEAVLGESLAVRIGDVVGSIRSTGGRARDSHKEFTKLVRKRSKRRPS